jgi:hypothetical protein
VGVGVSELRVFTWEYRLKGERVGVTNLAAGVLASCCMCNELTVTKSYI